MSLSPHRQRRCGRQHRTYQQRHRPRLTSVCPTNLRRHWLHHLVRQIRSHLPLARSPIQHCRRDQLWPWAATELECQRRWQRYQQQLPRVIHPSSRPLVRRTRSRRTSALALNQPLLALNMQLARTKSCFRKPRPKVATSPPTTRRRQPSYRRALRRKCHRHDHQSRTATGIACTSDYISGIGCKRLSPQYTGPRLDTAAHTRSLHPVCRMA